MMKSTNGALAAVAAGVLLLGAVGTLAFWTGTPSIPGVISVIQRQGAVLIIATGLVGYAAAIFVAAMGTHRPRHVRR